MTGRGKSAGVGGDSLRDLVEQGFHKGAELAVCRGPQAVAVALDSLVQVAHRGDEAEPLQELVDLVVGGGQPQGGGHRPDEPTVLDDEPVSLKSAGKSRVPLGESRVLFPGWYAAAGRPLGEVADDRVYQVSPVAGRHLAVLQQVVDQAGRPRLHGPDDPGVLEAVIEQEGVDVALGEAVHRPASRDEGLPTELGLGSHCSESLSGDAGGGFATPDTRCLGPAGRDYPSVRRGEFDTHTVAHVHLLGNPHTRLPEHHLSLRRIVLGEGDGEGGRVLVPPYLGEADTVALGEPNQPALKAAAGEEQALDLSPRGAFEIDGDGSEREEVTLRDVLLRPALALADQDALAIRGTESDVHRDLAGSDLDLHVDAIASQRLPSFCRAHKEDGVGAEPLVLGVRRLRRTAAAQLPFPGLARHALKRTTPPAVLALHPLPALHPAGQQPGALRNLEVRGPSSP